MKERYLRNIPAISEENQKLLASKTVFIAGLGGLGGYVAEELARLGIGRLVVADGDVFSSSNLNRQLLSTTANLGVPKASVAEARIREIDPDVEVLSIPSFIDEENISSLLTGCDLAVDALDNAPARLILEDACTASGIALIHGAINGWCLQACVCAPGSGILHSLYPSVSSSADNNDPVLKTCLPMTAACCASIEVSEALKVLLGINSALSGQLFYLDLKNMGTYTASFDA